MGARKTKKLSKDQEELFAGVIGVIEEMVTDLQEAGAPTRELSLLITKLEEAEMWGLRAFEVLGYEELPLPEVPEDEGDDDQDEPEGDDGDEEEDEEDEE